MGFWSCTIKPFLHAIRCMLRVMGDSQAGLGAHATRCAFTKRMSAVNCTALAVAVLPASPLVRASHMACRNFYYALECFMREFAPDLRRG